MNALMLAVAARLVNCRVRLTGMLAGALAGAGVAAAARRFALGRMETACLWLPTAMLMMALACGKRAIAQPVRHALVLLCAAGLLGGTVLCIHGATGSLLIAYALGALGMTGAALSTLRSRRAALDVRRARLTIRERGQAAVFDAMIDSGNTLRDYLTGLPVIVLAQGSAQRALHLAERPLRPIFADTAGGRQRMQAFTPENIVLEADGKRRFVRAAVALAPGYGGPALVPLSLLEEDSLNEDGLDTDGIED